MKKIFVLALVLTTIATTAFSRNPNDISDNILTAFSKSFSNARNVVWETKKDFIRAKFTVEGQVMFAYYKQDGEQMALTRNLTCTQLPIRLSSSLKAKYQEFWLSDLFEVSSEGETTYYATIRNAEKIIVLQATGTGGWITYKREKI